MSSRAHPNHMVSPMFAMLAFIAATFLATATPVYAEGTKPVPLVFGNPEGKLTIVEFIDYQCPSCKALHTRLLYRVTKDGDIRMEIREVAIIGPGSVYAAHAAMAAGIQGRRNELHLALVRFRGAMSERNVLKIAELTGLDQDRLKLDIGKEAFDKQLQANLNEGISHMLSGTPAFLIGDRFLQGPTLEKVLDTIDEVRDSRS